MAPALFSGIIIATFTGVVFALRCPTSEIVVILLNYPPYILTAFFAGYFVERSIQHLSEKAIRIGTRVQTWGLYVLLPFILPHYVTAKDIAAIAQQTSTSIETATTHCWVAAMLICTVVQAVWVSINLYVITKRLKCA